MSRSPKQKRPEGVRPTDRDRTPTRGQDPSPEDRFAHVAPHYDRWIGWGPRLAKEMPFLIETLAAARAAVDRSRHAAWGRVLDAGCGTGAHSIALARAGFAVTGVDRSESMLAQAREAEREASLPPSQAQTTIPSPGERGIDQAAPRHGDGPDHTPAPAPSPVEPVEWCLADATDADALAGRRFLAVLALGNVLSSFGEEDELVLRGLNVLIGATAPGGALVLQYLNGDRIRHHGRLVVKGEDDEIWLRHHFEAAGRIWFHSYTLSRGETGWAAEVRAAPVVEMPPSRIGPILEAHFQTVEFFDGLSGAPFRPKESDAVGVRARGRRGAAAS